MADSGGHKNRLVLYGIGSEYVYDTMEIVERARLEVAAFVDNLDSGQAFPGLEPVLTPSECSDGVKANPTFIPLITPGHRKVLLTQLEELGFFIGEALIDPTAVLPSRMSYDRGLQANAGVVVGARSEFGKQVLINRSSSIGHDAKVADYATFGPGCLLCGSCRIGAGAFIGGGATIAPEVMVGENAIIGAGAVVVKDVPANTVVAGNPARIIREGIQGYNDVGV